LFKNKDRFQQDESVEYAFTPWFFLKEVIIKKQLSLS
jgi:hypothetical protein